MLFCLSSVENVDGQIKPESSNIRAITKMVLGKMGGFMSSRSFCSIKGNMVGTPERCNSDRSPRSFCGFQLILETRATIVSIFLRFLIVFSTNRRGKTRTLSAIETRCDAHSGSGSSDTRGGSQKRGKMISQESETSSKGYDVWMTSPQRLLMSGSTRWPPSSTLCLPNIVGIILHHQNPRL